MSAHAPGLRKFPYPYQAMLALANDIDETRLEDFRLLHRFLNTHEETTYGEGLGLDVGDSFWMYGPDDTTLMTYWKGYSWGEENNAREVLKYIQCGWIDSIHTYGDFNQADAFTREHAQKALAELRKQGVKMRVWLNHGNPNNRQNFPGAFLTMPYLQYMQGDLPGSPAYHTDLTVPYGIQFVQDNSLNDVVGHENLLRPISLWDGQQVWGFRRLEARRESAWRKGIRLALERVGLHLLYWIWHPERLGEQLSRHNLDSLVANQHYSVIAQHLGKWRKPLPAGAIEGLLRLKEMNDSGKILVARLSRLLEYNRAHRHVRYSSVNKEGKTFINILTIDDPVCGSFVPTLDQVRGLCFTSINDPDKSVIMLGGELLGDDLVLRSGADRCIGIKWHEPDYRDYSE